MSFKIGGNLIRCLSVMETKAETLLENIQQLRDLLEDMQTAVDGGDPPQEMEAIDVLMGSMVVTTGADHLNNLAVVYADLLNLVLPENTPHLPDGKNTA